MILSHTHQFIFVKTRKVAGTSVTFAWSRSASCGTASFSFASDALAVEGDRSIVLLSDGADTVSKNHTKDLAGATAQLKKLRIRVDVVKFKTNDPDAVVALNGFAKAGGAGPGLLAALISRAVHDALMRSFSPTRTRITSAARKRCSMRSTSASSSIRDSLPARTYS